MMEAQNMTTGPFESFPNFTWEMYDGNKPAGNGHEHINGGYCDRWSTRYGGGESYKGELINADFSISRKVTIYIIGASNLWITDIRHDGKPDVWEYSNTDMSLCTPIAPMHLHELEPERIEKYLNSKFDCEFWRMVQARAKSIYEERKK